MTLLITVNKKHVYNVTFISVINKVLVSKVFLYIVVVSLFYASEYGTYMQRKVELDRHIN
jgi:hypothetical protein